MVRYTVIIPAYNAESTLARCLDSLLTQGREDIRILIIDDGSADDTGRIAREYCRTDRRVEYFHQSNAGVSAARNAGLALADSEFISFVDSDDYVMPGYFEVLDRIEDHDLLVFDRCHTGGTARNDEPVFEKLSAMTDTGEKLELLMHSKKIMQPWNKCYRLSLIRRYEIRFDETLHIGEDFAFCMAYAVRCGSITVSREKAYCIDVSDGGSLSRRYRRDLAEQLSSVAALVEASIRSSSLSGDLTDRLLARLDELDSRNLLMSIAEEFKAAPFGAPSHRRRTADICRLFRREFSSRRLGRQHTLLRLMLQLRLHFALYTLAWAVRGRQYRSVSNIQTGGIL